MSIKTHVDQRILEGILSSINTVNMSAMQVINIVFDRTAHHFKVQWLESEAQCDKLTDVVVKKNIEIDRLNGKIAELTKDEELLHVKQTNINN